jgi:hypothetical protein
MEESHWRKSVRYNLYYIIGEIVMPYQSRIKHLEQLHKDIDREIDLMEKNHPHVQEKRVHDLKKKRLQYRDELARLKKSQWEEDHERVNMDDDR